MLRNTVACMVVFVYELFYFYLRVTSLHGSTQSDQCCITLCLEYLFVWFTVAQRKRVIFTSMLIVTCVVNGLLRVDATMTNSIFYNILICEEVTFRLTSNV